MFKEDLKNFTLLYAEDDKSIQAEMFEYFSTFFKEVYLADNGKEAFEIYKEKEPDVLILDVHMPKLSGIEIAKSIRKNDNQTKIVLITAYSNDSLMLDAINIDINYYIIKPATLQKIKNMLSKISNDLVRSSFNIIQLDYENDVYFNPFSNQLFKNNQEIKLSKKEGDLLELFVKNISKPVSMEEIVSFCWKEFLEEATFDNVKSLLENLRKKLPENIILNIDEKNFILNKR